MKSFKTKTTARIQNTIIIIIVMTFILLNFYNKHITSNILDVSKTKLEEITNVYVKKYIVPKDENVNDLITIHKNNKDEILYVDINTEEANRIMVNVVSRIQNGIYELDTMEDELLKKHDNNYYIELPLSFSNGSLISNIGPKIPIKLSFYEQVLASVDTEVTNYGINNALAKIYLTINLEQKIYIPFKKDKFEREYKLLLSAKMINGRVPSFLGNSISDQQEIKVS